MRPLIRVLPAAVAGTVLAAAAPAALADLRSGVERGLASSQAEACESATRSAHSAVNNPLFGPQGFRVAKFSVQACECAKESENLWLCTVEWAVDLQPNR